MQEEQTVTFQPIYEGYQPWFAKLYVIYLLIIAVVTLTRCAGFVWCLRKLRKDNKQAESVFNSMWTDCCARVTSSRELAKFTLLVSLLNFSWWTADIFLAVRTAKAPNLGYILPAIGDALTALALGTMICVALYGGSMWAQSALKRRKTAWLGQNRSISN